MNGVIIINKEQNCTSRDVVNDLIHIFNTRKIGHTGTLDPIATGVLIICIGKCTKLVDLLTSKEKEYEATIKLGIKTDTGDITGSVIEKKEFNLNEELITKTLESFLGTYDQKVPIYSAVKINGKKLYEYARRGENVEVPTREVTIKKIELLSFKNDEIKFKVIVSKGTYIRSLIEDICAKMNTVGTMKTLNRTKQGIFTIEDSYSIEDIKNNNYKLLTIEEILSDMDKIKIDDKIFEKVKNGSIINKTFEQNKVALDYKGKIVAIYKEYEKDDKKAKPYIMF